MRKGRNRQYIEPSHPSSFLSGMTLGMMAGAVGYFLFATKKGGKIRRQLIKQAQEGWDEVGEVIEKAEKKGKELTKDVKKIRKKVESEVQKTQIKAAKELKQLQGKTKEAQERADAMQEKLKKTAAKIEKRFFTKSGRSLGK